jgi:putative acetyltransferase
LIVRRATQADSISWAAVLHDVAEEREWIAPEPPVDVAEAAERVKSWLREGCALWVLEEDGVVGCLELHPSGASGVVSLGMMVQASHRGRGGGWMLLEAAFDHASAAGLHKIELEVFAENGRAIALYTLAGFAVEGVRRDHYLRLDGRRHSSLIMARFVHPL